MTFDAKDEHSLTLGAVAPAAAPSFSATLTAAEVEYMRMEIDAAGKERDALERYEQTQRELLQHSRDVMMQCLRTECTRANRAERREAQLRRALWAAVALGAYETMMLLWVVLR